MTHFEAHKQKPLCVLAQWVKGTDVLIDDYLHKHILPTNFDPTDLKITDTISLEEKLHIIETRLNMLTHAAQFGVPIEYYGTDLQASSIRDLSNRGIAVKLGQPLEYGAEHYTLPHRLDAVTETELNKLIPELNLPPSLSFDEYEAQSNRELPVMLKFPQFQRGVGKFVLTEECQVEKALQLMRSRNALAKSAIFQTFIETPSEHATTYRVLMSASGAIVGAYLGYSSDDATTGDQRDIPSDLLPLYDENSEYFVGKAATSQLLHTPHSASRQIALNRTDASKPIEPHERDILAAHGLDENDPRIPEALIARSRKLAELTSEDAGGIIYGTDFIQAQNGQLHFLEQNQKPGPAAFIAANWRHILELSQERPESFDVMYSMTLTAMKSLAMTFPLLPIGGDAANK
jgi:hypothetical protein